MGEKDVRALITNIQGFSTEDGPGIRSTVFFKGCPLSCPWCHNPEGMNAKAELIFHAERCIGCKACAGVCKHGAPLPGAAECERCFACADACPTRARERMGRWWSLDELLAEVLKDRVYYSTSGGGVTASGGEAMLWSDFLTLFFQRLRAEGIHTALDTSGAIGGEKLDAVLDHTDLALIDLKILDPARHQKLLGVDLLLILKHLRQIDASGVPIIIRLPVVPGYTDGPENLAAAADFAASLEHLLQVELLPYHRLAEPKYQQLGRAYGLADVVPPTAEAMERARAVFTARSLKTLLAGE